MSVPRSLGGTHFGKAAVSMRRAKIDPRSFSESRGTTRAPFVDYVHSNQASLLYSSGGRFSSATDAAVDRAPIYGFRRRLRRHCVCVCVCVCRNVFAMSHCCLRQQCRRVPLTARARSVYIKGSHAISCVNCRCPLYYLKSELNDGSSLYSTMRLV